MAIKLILADMDGTVLRNDKTVSQETLRVLAAAMEQGYLFAPATGRFLKALPQEIRNLPLFRYAILMNGAIVYDAKEDKILHRAEISAETADRIFGWLEQFPVSLDCYAEGDYGWMDERFYKDLENWVLDPGARKIVRETRLPKANLRGYIRGREEPVQKIQVFTRDEKLRQWILTKLTQEFPEVTVSTSLPGNLEINHQNATKGKAMEFLCTYLGVKLDEVMAFGDESNDCAMLELAGVGISMGNGAECAKRAADWGTRSNEEDGVAYAIRKVLFKE